MESSGRRVVAEMNVPVEDAHRQIELNLERWRWLPRDLGERTSSSTFRTMRLEVWDNGSVPLYDARRRRQARTRRRRSSTTTMTYLVFSPYWNVPPDIAKNETLPADPEGSRRFWPATTWKSSTRRGNVVDPSDDRPRRSDLRTASGSGRAPATRSAW